MMQVFNPASRAHTLMRLHEFVPLVHLHCFLCMERSFLDRLLRLSKSAAQNSQTGLMMSILPPMMEVFALLTWLATSDDCTALQLNNPRGTCCSLHPARTFLAVLHDPPVRPHTLSLT